MMTSHSRPCSASIAGGFCPVGRTFLPVLIALLIPGAERAWGQGRSVGRSARGQLTPAASPAPGTPKQTEPSPAELAYVALPALLVSATESMTQESYTVLATGVTDFTIRWPVTDLNPFREHRIDTGLALYYDAIGGLGDTTAIEVGRASLQDGKLTWRWNALHLRGSRVRDALAELDNLMGYATIETNGGEGAKWLQLMEPRPIGATFGKQVSISGVWPKCQPILALGESTAWKGAPSRGDLIEVQHQLGRSFHLQLKQSEDSLKLEWIWGMELRESLKHISKQVTQKRDQVQLAKRQYHSAKLARERYLREKSDSGRGGGRGGSTKNDKKKNRRKRPPPSSEKIASLRSHSGGLARELATLEARQQKAKMMLRQARWPKAVVGDLAELPTVRIVAARSGAVVAELRFDR